MTDEEKLQAEAEQLVTEARSELAAMPLTGNVAVEVVGGEANQELFRCFAPELLEVELPGSDVYQQQVAAELEALATAIASDARRTEIVDDEGEESQDH